MLGKLTDTAIKNARPRPQPYKLTDGGGMYLLVTTRSGKWWRLDYRLKGKRKTISLGTYPDVNLKRARQLRQDAREDIAAGVDPSTNRKAVKAASLGATSFEVVAKEWLTKFSHDWALSHTEKIRLRLENDVYPWLGGQDVDDIKAPDLLRVLRRVEERGALETAHRIRQICGAIFRFAVATGRADRDPSQDLKGALPPRNEKHYPTITKPKEISALLRAIDGYKGHFVTRCALQLAVLTFVRPGELRHVELHPIMIQIQQIFAPCDDPLSPEISG